jgi:hypothetical protein
MNCHWKEMMKYPDGQEVRLGDRVKLGGIVVASIDTNEYSPEHLAAQWSYLKKGVMIEFSGTYGLIHYEEPDADLQLIARAPAATGGRMRSRAR